MANRAPERQIFGGASGASVNSAYMSIFYIHKADIKKYRQILCTFYKKYRQILCIFRQKYRQILCIALELYEKK